MLEGWAVEVGCRLTSSDGNSGEEPVVEWELEREGMKTVGRGNAAWKET